MNGYPDNHLCHDPGGVPEGGLFVGGMFPVVYDWDESAVVRRYALAVGLAAGEPVQVWASFTCFLDEAPTLDVFSIGRVQDAGDESILFDDRPEIDFTELRRYVIADALEGLPREGVDVTGVVSAIKEE